MAYTPMKSSDYTVSAKKSIEDAITNVSPTDTPIYSSLKNTNVDNTTHYWLEDKIERPTGVTPINEGFTWNFPAGTERTQLSNVCQIFWKAVSVTDTAQAVKKEGGVKDELAYQFAKKMKEFAMDVEYQIINSAATQNTDPRIMGGLPYFLTTGYNSTVINGGGGSLTEDLLLDLLQGIWEKGADPKVVYTSATLKRKIGTFANSDRQRTIEESSKVLTQGIDVYESDFGTVVLKPHRDMKYTSSYDVDTNSDGTDDAYSNKIICINPEYLKIGYLRRPKKVNGSKDGSYTGKGIEGELTLICLTPKAHGYIWNVKV